MSNRENIKVKKVVTGLDANKKVGFTPKSLEADIYVQITQDKFDTIISLEQFTVSLTKLGYKIVRDI